MLNFAAKPGTAQLQPYQVPQMSCWADDQMHQPANGAAIPEAALGNPDGLAGNQDLSIYFRQADPRCMHHFGYQVDATLWVTGWCQSSPGTADGAAGNRQDQGMMKQQQADG